MKYQIYKLSLIITLSISLFACDSDLELDNKQYYLHCHVYEGKSPKIVIGKTLDVFPAYPFNIEYHEPLINYGNFDQFIKFSISGENEVYTNFEMRYFDIQDPYQPGHFNTHEITYFTDESFIPKPGKEYEIEIINLNTNDPDLKDFKGLKSKTYIPEKISTTSEIIENTDTTFYKYRLDISFDDPADDKNYYFLTVSSIQSMDSISMDTINMDEIWNMEDYYNLPYGWQNISYRLQDANDYVPWDQDQHMYGPTPLNGKLINDEEFNGQTKTFSLSLWSFDVDPDDFYKCFVIELMHISEEYYKYYSAINKQLNSQNDIFSEPAQLFSNVENGIGIFAGATIATEFIEVK